MSSITIKKGEAKDIQFTYTIDGVAQDVSSNTFSFKVKENILSETYVIEKADIDFDKTDAANGIVTCNITTTDSNIEARTYIAEIQMIVIAGTNVDKSTDITFIIDEAVI